VTTTHLHWPHSDASYRNTTPKAGDGDGDRVRVPVVDTDRVRDVDSDLDEENDGHGVSVRVADGVVEAAPDVALLALVDGDGESDDVSDGEPLLLTDGERDATASTGDRDVVGDLLADASDDALRDAVIDALTVRELDCDGGVLSLADSDAVSDALADADSDVDALPTAVDSADSLPLSLIDGGGDADGVSLTDSDSESDSDSDSDSDGDADSLAPSGDATLADAVTDGAARAGGTAASESSSSSDATMSHRQPVACERAAVRVHDSGAAPHSLATGCCSSYDEDATGGAP
jgi:hypothetical protein